jgi:phosphatidylglycerophosphate synthase
MNSESSVFRTREIEDPSNRYLIHPLSHWLARHLARLGVSPNAVSLSSLPFGLAAAWLLFHYENKPGVIVAFLLLGAWHVIDGADGQVARMTGKSSEFGKVLDGVCDYLVYGAVYVAMTMALVPDHGMLAWWLALAAGLSHAVQSSLYEFYRYEYDLWVHGNRSRRVPMPTDLRAAAAERHGIGRLFTRIHYIYVRGQFLGAGGRELLRKRLDTVLADGGADAERLRRRYRELNLSAVHHWSWLNANTRTLLIFVFCLLFSPLWFFLWELLVLNVVMVLLALDQRRRDRRLLDEVFVAEGI